MCVERFFFFVFIENLFLERFVIRIKFLILILDNFIESKRENNNC